MARADVTYPFWAHPIPKFIKNQGGTTPEDLSYVATLPLGGYSFDTKGSVGRYTGADGPQQSAEETTSDLARPAAPATITTSSNSTR